MVLDRVCLRTEFKRFALIALLTLTVSGGVYLLQLRGVDGANVTGTGSGKAIPNLCMAVGYCCPTFSKTINLSNDTIEQDELDAATAGSNLYILWKEPVYLYVPGPLFLIKSTDNGHTFGSKTELVGETSKSYLAAYGNNVYVLFTTDTGVFLIKSTDGGNSFGSPIKLNQLNGIAQPTKDNGIKIRAFGNSVYIVWVEKFSSNDEVFFIKSTDGGNSFSDKKSLSLTANNAISREPSLEIDGNNVYVVWEDWVTYAYPDIFFKRSVDGGNSFGKLINLSNNPSSSTGPHIGSFGDKVYAVWHDWTGPNDKAMILRKSSDAGHTFGSNKVISSGGYGALVDVTSDNKVYLVWSHDGGIFFKRSINEGTSFSCLTKINSPTGTENDVHLISTDARVFVLWRNYVNIGEDGMNMEVFFRATPPQ